MGKNVYTAVESSHEDAFKEADIVLVGKITQLGIAEPEGMGQLYFSDTEVEIQTIEKGNLNGTKCLIGYQVVSFKDLKKAPTPEPGASYRFYISIREQGKTLKAFKISDP